ncbi:MAG: hypothetical protein M3N29_03775, partial [Chloroflexota bacterium]|nr:hypothetical protein [Chloroflexota bacterium]
MPEHEPDLFDRLLELLSALVMPVWNDLIALIPLVLLGVVVVFFLGMAWLWRRASARNQPRLIPRLAAGPPPPGIHLPGPSRWPFVVPIGATLLLFAFILPPRDDAGQPAFPVNLTLLAVGVLVTLVALAGWLVDAMRE